MIMLIRWNRMVKNLNGEVVETRELRAELL